MKKKIFLILISLIVLVSISGCNINNNGKSSYAQNEILKENSSPELKEIDKNINEFQEEVSDIKLGISDLYPSEDEEENDDVIYVFDYNISELSKKIEVYKSTVEKSYKKKSISIEEYHDRIEKLNKLKNELDKSVKSLEKTFNLKE